MQATLPEDLWAADQSVYSKTGVLERGVLILVHIIAIAWIVPLEALLNS